MQNAEVRVHVVFMLFEFHQKYLEENLTSAFLQVFPADSSGFLQPAAVGQPEVPHAADDTATISASQVRIYTSVSCGATLSAVNNLTSTTNS